MNHITNIRMGDQLGIVDNIKVRTQRHHSGFLAISLTARIIFQFDNFGVNEKPADYQNMPEELLDYIPPNNRSKGFVITRFGDPEYKPDYVVREIEWSNLQ